MSWIVSKIRWIMLVSGILTCSMLLAALAPQAALRSMFGATVDGPVAEVVVRNWGALIALVGATLIYASSRPAVRPLALVLAIVSKLIFITLVLVFGREFLSHQAGGAVVGDSLMVVLFLVYLLGRR
jgi:hypothetical protein